MKPAKFGATERAARSVDEPSNLMALFCKVSSAFICYRRPTLLYGISGRSKASIKCGFRAGLDRARQMESYIW